MTPAEAATPSSALPGAVVLRGAFPEDTGPVGSVAHALQRALRLPGARAVAIGELGRPDPLAWAELPDVDPDLARRSGRAPIVMARRLGQESETPEELVVTGLLDLSLLRTAPLPGGEWAYIQLTLARSTANLALAAMGLRSLALDLPRLLMAEPPRAQTTGRSRLPRRARGDGDSPRPEPALSVPLSTLQLVLERLRLL
ncbi:hypothetical protein [Streptacidiphilus rugosus]|uniref:hypothetical protein n=1 Tax=Streptacidiphilus rugosus TaxID=405783 RepID=UPI00055B693C|nr:hypothetical protein [Streptacidiphilus rugosus]